MLVEALALTEKDAHTLQVGKEYAMGKACRNTELFTNLLMALTGATLC